jgi:hypothetical protein
MNQSAWSVLLSVGFSMLLSILISTISVKAKDSLVAFRKRPTQPGRDPNAPKTLLTALLNLFPHCGGAGCAGLIRLTER